MNNSAEALKWRTARGQKGVLWSPIGRGSLINDSIRQAWFFCVSRGSNENDATDSWGPLDAPLNDETAAVHAALKLERQLDRAGWFALKKEEKGGWNGPDMDTCLDKIPRRLIPHYFLSSFDETQAARGKARKGNVLHVGGADVHLWKSNAVDAGMYLDTEATLVFSPPGEKPHRGNKNSFLLKLGGNGFDALIAYLLEIRSGLATEEAFQAGAKEVGRELPGDFSSEDGLRSRYLRMQQKSASISDMMTRLFSLPPTNLATLFMILETMERGDRISGLLVTADDGTAAMVEMLVSPESKTATALDLQNQIHSVPVGTLH